MAPVETVKRDNAIPIFSMMVFRTLKPIFSMMVLTNPETCRRTLNLKVEKIQKVEKNGNND